MIYRSACIVLIFTVQFVLSSTSSLATSEPPLQKAGPVPTATADLLQRGASAPTPLQLLSSLPDSSQPNQVVQIETPHIQPPPSLATDKQGLAELIGKTEISVLGDIDAQFVDSLAELQITANEHPFSEVETTLLKSIGYGRSFNRDSLAALARSEQAKAQTGQARALLLPSAAYRLSGGRERSQPSVNIDETTGLLLASDTHSRSDSSLYVKQPLFDLPGILDWRRRKVIEKARDESYRVSDGDAYTSVVNAYLSLVSSRLQADLTREFEAQLSDLLKYIEKRAGAGAASISDMARVQARSQATLSSRLEQESACAAAGIEFVRLTNLTPQKLRLPALDDIGVVLLPKSFNAAVTAAMKSNPDIAALTAELDAAKIDKRAAEGRFLPRLDAEYTDSHSVHAGGNPDPAGQRDKRLMLVMNWSLFNGGSDYLARAERSARHKELLFRLDDQRRRVVQSLLANYSTLTTTRERIDSGYQELKSISTATEAMSKRMLSGNQSLLDLLDVYDRHYQVRSRLVSLHILEISTAAQLVRLTLGTPDATIESEIKPSQGDTAEPTLRDVFVTP